MSQKIYKVICHSHDKGSKGCVLIRETEQDAERTADLMWQCGYKTYIIADWS